MFIKSFESTDAKHSKNQSALDELKVDIAKVLLKSLKEQQLKEFLLESGFSVIPEKQKSEIEVRLDSLEQRLEKIYDENDKKKI